MTRTKNLLVRNKNTSKIYKVVGTYFNVAAGEGKVYLQGKDGVEDSVTLSSFLGNFEQVYSEKIENSQKPLPNKVISDKDVVLSADPAIECYTIVSAPTPENLAYQIQCMLSAGWALWGNIATGLNEDRAVYVQPMVAFKNTSYIPECEVKME